MMKSIQYIRDRSRFTKRLSQVAVKALIARIPDQKFVHNIIDPVTAPRKNGVVIVMDDHTGSPVYFGEAGGLGTYWSRDPNDALVIADTNDAETIIAAMGWDSYVVRAQPRNVLK